MSIPTESRDWWTCDRCRKLQPPSGGYTLGAYGDIYCATCSKGMEFCTKCGSVSNDDEPCSECGSHERQSYSQRRVQTARLNARWPGQ